MNEPYCIQVPYNVVCNPTEHIQQINNQLTNWLTAKKRPLFKFQAIYSATVNTETGLTHVSGKVYTGDQRLVINDIEFPLSLPNALVTVNNTVTRPRFFERFSIEECVRNVLGWSRDRGILEHGRWYTQVTKFYEELGEISTGVSKDKRRLVMDGVGDILVVLINISALTGVDLDYLIKQITEANDTTDPDLNYPECRDQSKTRHDLVYKLYKHFTDLFGYLQNAAVTEITGSEYFDSNLRRGLRYSSYLAREYNTTLEECFCLAWDEIKDRKGRLNADGIFVKESDLAKI